MSYYNVLLTYFTTITSGKINSRTLEKLEGVNTSLLSVFVGSCPTAADVDFYTGMSQDSYGQKLTLDIEEVDNTKVRVVISFEGLVLMQSLEPHNTREFFIDCLHKAIFLVLGFSLKNNRFNEYKTRIPEIAEHARPGNFIYSYYLHNILYYSLRDTNKLITIRCLNDDLEVEFMPRVIDNLGTYKYSWRKNGGRSPVINLASIIHGKINSGETKYTAPSSFTIEVDHEICRPKPTKSARNTVNPY